MINVSQVWLMDVGNGAERAFLNIEDAYQSAYDTLISWGYSPDAEDEGERSIFTELKESYEDEKYAGFFVDEMIWCWAVDLH